MSTTRHDLPAQLTSFVGRLAESEDLDHLLAGERLVTLTGAGGCGKTRLAIHVAGERLALHPDGVWFVDLAMVDDPAGVERAVADHVIASAPTIEAIASAIGDGAVLLVLDNCEHVIAACAAVADALLRSCPALSIVATSREPLGVDGEVTYLVPSLPAHDAATLFVDRARRAKPSVPDTQTELVDEICERLDGIPLAIELAAARMRVLSARQIRDGLRDRFRLLTGGSRTAVPRQQTLQASVDWSHDLLLDAERTVLRRLSVFAGGFTMEAAEAVASDDEIAPHHVFDLVTQLAEKSLVVAGEERFRLLETVRQYASQRLAEAGEAPATWQRHQAYFRAFVAMRRDESEIDYRDRIETDYENLRRALQWSAEHDDPVPLMQLTLALYAYWSTSRRTRDGAEWLSLAAERAPATDPATRAAIHRSRAFLVGLAGRWKEAHALALDAIELSRESGEPRGLVWALSHAALTGRNTGDPDADAYTDEAIQLATEAGYERGLAFARYQQGFGFLRDHADVERGFAALHDAVALARKTGLASVERLAQCLLAVGAIAAGELATAVEPLETARRRLRAVHDGFFLGDVLGGIIHCRSLMGDDAGADEAFAELDALDRETPNSAFRIGRWYGSTMAMIARGEWTALAAHVDTMSADALVNSRSNRFHVLAWSAIARSFMGDHERADDLTARAVALGVEHGVGPPPASVAALVALHGGDLGRAEERAHAALATFDRPRPALSTVTCLLLHAVVASRRGRREDAVRIFGAAAAHAARVGMSTSSGLWRSFEGDEPDALKAALGRDFDELWAEGAALSLTDTIAFIRRGRGARSRPSHGWDSLTPTEQQVVALVGDGCTNKDIAARLFMSVATVKSHLTHVYGKLGIASRAELSAAYARRGVADSESACES